MSGLICLRLDSPNTNWSETEAFGPAKSDPEALLETLEQLTPMARLLDPADLEYLRGYGASNATLRCFRRGRSRLYFEYLRVLAGILDQAMVKWAHHLGQAPCTFEALDRARWQINKSLLLLHWDGLRFRLGIPLDSQATARRLAGINGLVFGFEPSRTA